MIEVTRVDYIRVPVDDTHTLHIYYSVYRPRIPVAPQDSIPVYEIPLRDQDGRFAIDFTIAGYRIAIASAASGPGNSGTA